jgi:hypothetical protein
MGLHLVAVVRRRTPGRPESEETSRPEQLRARFVFCLQSTTQSAANGATACINRRITRKWVAIKRIAQLG